jgi:hypothetical protein
MSDIIDSMLKIPLPNTLVFVGALFLFIGFGGQDTKLKLIDSDKVNLRYVGIAFVSTGIVLYLPAAFLTTPESPGDFPLPSGTIRPSVQNADEKRGKNYRELNQESLPTATAARNYDRETSPAWDKARATITDPADQEKITRRVNIKGTHQTIPEAAEMWLYRQSISTGLFYVDPIFKYNDGLWETKEITVGAADSHKIGYRMGVILVDQSGAKVLRQTHDEIEDLPANRRISTEIIITRK